ncbi:MAG: FAD:protein FMN transferase [Chthonomonadales bacterium]
MTRRSAGTAERVAEVSSPAMLSTFIVRLLARWAERLADADPQRLPTPPSPDECGSPPAQTPMEPEQDPDWVYPRVSRAAMGSLFEIYLAGHDREALVGAANEALDEIERLDRQLSHYRMDSDIARMNAHASRQWVRLEPRLYLLLKRCAELSAQTHGAFDITAAPLVKAWGFHEGTGRVPSSKEIEELLSRVGAHRIVFDDEEQLIWFSSPGMEVELGAVGKGYALDEAAERLRFYGVGAALLHGGQSTIYAHGAPPGEDGWEFVLKDPRDRATPIDTVCLRDQAISTSGCYEQFLEIDGKRYCHILDPRSGEPVEGMLSVWVIAPSAMEADALSTAFFVMGRDATEEFCRLHPNLGVIMVTEQGDGIAVSRLGCIPAAGSNRSGPPDAALPPQD